MIPGLKHVFRKGWKQMAYYILQEQSGRAMLVPGRQERNTLSILSMVVGVLLLGVAPYSIMRHARDITGFTFWLITVVGLFVAGVLVRARWTEVEAGNSQFVRRRRGRRF